MAAPQVAKVAAKIKAVRPDLKAAEIRQIIMATVTPMPKAEDRSRLKSGGMLNEVAALERAISFAM